MNDEDIDPLDRMLNARAQRREGSSSPSRPPRPPPENPINGVRKEAWLTKALVDEKAKLLAMPVGSRNNGLNTVAFTLGGHVGPGRLTEDQVVAGLWEVGREVGLPDWEIAKILPRSVRDGAEKPFDLPDLDDDDLDVPPVSVYGPSGHHDGGGGGGGGTTEGADDRHADFWASRAMLKYVHTWAQARRVSPWAVLGVLLARVATATPWYIGLPPVVGAWGSLNTFVGLVGPSGAGKSAAMAVAEEAVNLGEIHELKVGSGEGIAHTYRKRNKDGTEDWRVHAALFEIPEVDMLTALGSRQGATLLPELRSAWTGERLGFGYADLGKRLLIPPHQYRLSLIVAIQPRRARALLNAADAGTPQRFLWLPARDPTAPVVAPEVPDRVRWQSPDWERVRQGWPRSFAGVSAMPVWPEVHGIVNEAFLRRLRGEVDALDGHALLCREKVAACLALLDDRVEIGEEDWQLAGVVMEVSARTREGVGQDLKDAEREASFAEAVHQAKVSLVMAEEVERATLGRVIRNLLRFLTAHPGWIASGVLRRDALGSKDRRFYEGAILRLVENGQVETEVAEDTIRYRVPE